MAALTPQHTRRVAFYLPLGGRCSLGLPSRDDGPPGDSPASPPAAEADFVEGVSTNCLAAGDGCLVEDDEHLRGRWTDRGVTLSMQDAGPTRGPLPFERRELGGVGS